MTALSHAEFILPSNNIAMACSTHTSTHGRMVEMNENSHFYIHFFKWILSVGPNRPLLLTGGYLVSLGWMAHYLLAAEILAKNSELSGHGSDPPVSHLRFS